MIKVLQNWEEIGDAFLTLQINHLPTHPSIQKNWDYFLLYNILTKKNRALKVLDLGCGEGGHTLRFLHALDFLNLYGIDLNIKWKLRLRQIYLILKTRKKPFTLHQGDFHKTKFKNEVFDFIYSISVIEHGVNIKSFLEEAHRILKPNGLIFITTDYWKENLNIDNQIRVYGLPWKIFSSKDIESLILEAKEIGFNLVENTTIPSCCKKTVCWQDTEYTFIALLFKKHS